eukprot:4124950-Alexandrium_andersonii.AAC.1
MCIRDRVDAELVAAARHDAIRSSAEVVKGEPRAEPGYVGEVLVPIDVEGVCRNSPGPSTLPVQPPGSRS